jgi:hypothetical protein
MNTNVPQDVIELAKQAGFDVDDDGDIWGSENGSLLRFAELLRAQRAGGEAVAYLDFNGELKPTRHGVITMKKGDNLYTQPQPTLDFAAGMMKAAEIAKKRSDTNWEIGNAHAEGSDVRHERHDRAVEAKLISEQILSAIPKESADALKEYVSGKCMEVAQSVFRKKWNRELSVFAHEDELAAIVNSVLEGKS